jgi:hypothetical protein
VPIFTLFPKQESCFSANAIQVPSPGRLTRLELQKMLLSKVDEKLNGKERVASGFLVYQLRQRPGMGELTSQGVAKELVHVRKRQRLQLNLTHDRLGFANRTQRQHQRMVGSYFIISIRTD